MTLDLRSVIAQVESGRRLQAMRFEPVVFARLTHGVNFGPLLHRASSDNGACSHATACMICATSWGRYQILGENLYSWPDWPATSIFQFLGSSLIQETAFDQFLVSRGLAGATLEQLQSDAGARHRFISRYNGPDGVAEYWLAMQQAIIELSK